MSHDLKSDMESRRTVYPGPQILHLWANGCTRDLRGGNVSTADSGAVLYSYAAKIANRLPETVKTPDGHRVFLIRPAFRSRTTAKHINNAWHAVPFQAALADMESPWEGKDESPLPGQAAWNPKKANFIFSVPCVTPYGKTEHENNYRYLYDHALAFMGKLKTAQKYGNGNILADLFAKADYYRRTFIPDAARLTIPSDCAEILLKFNARKARAEAREKAEMESYNREVKAWYETHRKVLEVIRNRAAWNKQTGETATVFDKVKQWELTGQWDGEKETENLYRGIVHGLIGGNAALHDHPAVPGYIKAALPCRISIRPFPKHGKICGAYSVWDAAGVSQYGGFGGNAYINTETGRHLLRFSADGSELITSGGARLPVSLARLLWQRFGAYVQAAARGETPAWPLPGCGESIPFGPFAWAGFEPLPQAAWNSGGGTIGMRVGCHLISACDLARLAARFTA